MPIYLPGGPEVSTDTASVRSADPLHVCVKTALKSKTAPFAAG